MNTAIKKAVVVGGSNGIGLALSKNFIQKGYYVEVFDRCEPAKDVLEENHYTFHACNLLDFDSKLTDEFVALSKDPAVEILMLTAGFGRVADLEYMHTAEIDSLFKVNAIASIKIMRLFYARIKSNMPFYCGVMGSIAGLVSSPMFSVYAATKAAVCRFTESVNIELEYAGVHNRILNVSPGSIKGTNFNGGKTDLSQIDGLAQEIATHLLQSETQFIPQYEEVFKGVIDRYKKDEHEYGIHSYEYKKDCGRAQNERKVVIGFLSGTFDLFHVGHLNLLRRAKQQCDYLIVGVHPDASHKGKETFIPFDERMEIVGACKYVDRVVEASAEDSADWDIWHYDKLFVGSDYKGTERFQKYEQYFADKGVEIVYFPYTKSTSSTQIRKTIFAKTNDISEADMKKV